ncbi:MAG: type IV pili methyl-accepting chemotaxis transducer N-terminal domain-containing protein [Burkholderiales bacterium]|nr:type IV pili methyl-accepting chemotaxis transducer N-terminal domain-containing protein [Burkholderiales bacterium]
MNNRWSLTTKLVATGITFLVLALLSIGLTLWVSWNLEGGAAAVNEAGRLRMMTYRMALALPEQSAPPPGAFLLAEQFDASLQLLHSGDPSRPLFVPWSESSRTHFETVRTDWRNLRADWFAPVQGPRTKPLLRADAFVAEVDGFVAAIEHELARWTAILHLFQLAMMALAIASAVALLYTGYLLVLNPLARLRRGLAAVQQGDLATRIEVESGDEFGQMAGVFNEMAQTLQSLYDGLEERVRDKTRSLEAKRQRLADLYEVSAFLAGATQLDELAGGFARLVRRIAGADAAAVRWSDEANRRYVLLASDNMPDELQAEGRCLSPGACHCGQPSAHARTRAIPIVSHSPARKMVCERAGYNTLVSVPVKLHDQLMGEVDLFYRASVTLSPEDRDLLDTLANHLAGAMESLRASALEREGAVAGERGLIARELHDSIAQSLAFLKIQVQLLRDAVRSKDERATARIIDELDTGVRESYADVRELLVHFRTRTAEEDIEPALATTLNKFRHQTGLPAELEMEGHGVALAPDVQVQVLHILQEALSNVRKHAKAQHVVLKVDTAPNWRFEVRDDGVGFDAARPAPGETHVGLRIMQERALRIGARVHVDSAPGRGCSVVLET